MKVRDATSQDADQIAAIYSPYVSDTAVSFEVVPPSVEVMAERIRESTCRYPWIVAEIDGVIAGYSYARSFRTRRAFRFTAESTVYVHPKFQRRGVGEQLMRHLLNRLYNAGHHLVVACIALPNEGSVSLHERLGFHPNGVIPSVGQKFQQWHDVGFWSLTLSDSTLQVSGTVANDWRLRVCPPAGDDARHLMRQLSEELAERYDCVDDVSGGFDPNQGEENGAVFLVGWLDDQPVACGAICRMDADVAEVKRMFVRRDYRGNGLATQVLNRLELEAGRLGYKALRLETGTLQPEAIALYERAGFQRIPCYGPYAANERSVCYEKAISESG